MTTRAAAIVAVILAALGDGAAAQGVEPMPVSLWAGPGDAAELSATDQPPVFRTSVDLVSLAAVVRDRRGRFVRDLRRDDFKVFDAGIERQIVEFSPADNGPVSVALLVDTSGSMRISDNLDAGRAVARALVAQLAAGRDEVALYAFDSELRQLQAFTTAPADVEQALGALDAFGSTALYDAIGAAAEAAEQRPQRRRALIVVTDGLDTSSRRTVEEVSGIASRSDVPVYVVTVGAGDDPTSAAPPAAVEGGRTPHLGTLAYWTGGALVPGRAVPAAAAQAILSELRHQYLLAFESAGPGWRPIDVRLRRRDNVTVRTRSAYQSGRPAG